ncbi:MAG: hypothetical protein HKN88_07290 [Gammaproteobacteria bacterium]|nr:hypothetical protein [Gammaproteobacteria bacterium]NNC97862.1 hypothetical protein [Gammaproteobacteria bacterium]NNM12932.1 hypothetical protein [Gammaproteobacteria bacterium]
MKLHIIGDGVFGNFLREIFSPFVEFSPAADNVVLAVPIEAYEEVAAQYLGKHLINVCSVQRDSNNICLQFSDQVTGIHPLFGPRSPIENRVAVLTHRCEQTPELQALFEKLGAEVCDELPDGRSIDGELHDRMMADTHLAGLQQLATLKKIVENSAWVPKKFIPASFQRLQNFVEQSGDFSPGTLSSIQANPYAEKEYATEE